MLEMNIKECPFCGGTSLIFASEHGENFFVKCTKCFAQGPTARFEIPPYPSKYPSSEDRFRYAIDTWNMRTTKLEGGTE